MKVTSVLLSTILISVLDLLPQLQAVSSQSYLTISLTLVTNSSRSCDTGLTHNGVYAMVEYRLVEGQTGGEWQLLDTVTMEPTGKS